jgi:hypothetical protein
MFQIIKNWFRKSGPTESGRSGGRVWAPWEGQFLYSATIVSTAGESVTVRFDTGEEKPDVVSNLRQLEPEKQIVSGQQIFMMYDVEARSYLFYPAVVKRVVGEYFDVVRQNGETELRVHVKRVRVPESAIPLSLSPEWVLESFVRIREPDDLRATHRRDVDQLYQASDRVLARWHDYYWYPATVLSVANEGVHVRYSDGDMGLVSEKHIIPLFCEEGERIFIRPPEEARLAYSPAIVTRVAGELLDVEFEETEIQENRHVVGLSINRARFWRLPKGARPPSLEAGGAVLVLLGPHWYPGRILPERKENVFGPKDDVIFVELLNAAEDVMVTPELIKPLKFSVGQQVECGRGGGSYIPGTIVEMKGDKLFVKYP